MESPLSGVQTPPSAGWSSAANNAISSAADLAGGKEGLVGYLKTQAELVNPSAFMTGLSKLLPSMLEGNPDAPLIVERVYYTRDGDA